MLAGVRGAPHAEESVPIARVDRDRSEVAFRMRTTWHDVDGRAPIRIGSVHAQGDLFENARVWIEIDAAAMETGNTRRDRKMHEEVMGTGTWPLIRFASTRPAVVTLRDAQRTVLECAGTLEIRGRSREVTLAITVVPAEGGWRATGDHEVSLEAFGIPDPSIFLNRVRDAVQVRWDLLLVTDSAETPAGPGD